MFFTRPTCWKPALSTIATQCCETPRWSPENSVSRTVAVNTGIQELHVYFITEFWQLGNVTGKEEESSMFLGNKVMVKWQLCICSVLPRWVVPCSHPHRPSWPLTGDAVLTISFYPVLVKEWGNNLFSPWNMWWFKNKYDDYNKKIGTSLQQATQTHI